MSSTALRRLGLCLTFLFFLACCATVPRDAQTAPEASSQDEAPLKLRLVYSADTKGNYEPCPT